MFNLDLQESIMTKPEAEEISSKKFNLSADKAPLLRALAHIQSVVEKRNIIPMLSNVRLVAKDGKLELTSTDMDISVSEKITAYILDEGALTLPAHTLYDIVRKLPESANITIKLSGKFPGKVDIIADNSNFSLPFLSASEFPTMDRGVMPFKFSLSTSEVKTIIDKNKFAISTEETRYNLNGIYLHVVDMPVGKVLRAVATDGHRLSCVSLTVPEGAEKIPGVIIPKKAVTELRKIIDGSEAEIHIELSSTKIKFSYLEIEFITKLIDASFPEYEGLIPKETSVTMEVEKKKFIESVDRVSTITFEKTKALKLKIHHEQIEFIVVNEEIGEAQEISECKSDASNFEIGFNYRYLMDVSSVIDGDFAEFKFTDAFSPAKISDKSNNSVVYVIMPMRI